MSTKSTAEKEFRVMSYHTDSMIEYLGNWTMSFLKPTKKWSDKYRRQQLFIYYLMYNCVEQILFKESVLMDSKERCNYTDSRPLVCLHFTAETSGSVITDYFNDPKPKYHFGLVLCSWLDTEGSKFMEIFGDYLECIGYFKTPRMRNWPSKSLVTKYPIPIKRAAGFVCNYEIEDSEYHSYTLFSRSNYNKCRSKALLSLQATFPSIPLDILARETDHL